jgi:hypothetical protein
MKYILFLASLIILNSCETLSDGEFAEWSGVNSSVQGIMKAFDRVTPGGGIRGKSQNGREFVSRYHPPTGDVYATATTAKVRAYTKLTILGDRRPYVLQLHYIVEERDDSGNYRVVKRDKERANKILKDLHTFLVTRPDKDNFIDDFRPF